MVRIKKLICRYLLWSRFGPFIRSSVPRFYVRIKSESDSLREPEMELLHFLCNRSMLSVDVGVLWGSYTYLLAKYSRQCYAFEPNPNQIPFLKKCFGNKVKIIPKALSDKEGSGVLRVPYDILGHATIEPKNKLNGRNFKEYLIQTVRLDKYSLRNVSFIKIDVEGHEPNVLRGMSSTLDREKPFLFVEISQNHNPNSYKFVIEWMSKKGYYAFYYKNGFLFSLPSKIKLLHQITGHSSNIIFAHISKIEKIDSFISHN